MTSLSLFTFMHWRRNWQPTPVFLSGESQGRGSLVGCRYGVTQSRTRLKRLSSSSEYGKRGEGELKMPGTVFGVRWAWGEYWLYHTPALIFFLKSYYHYLLLCKPMSKYSVHTFETVHCLVPRLLPPTYPQLCHEYLSFHHFYFKQKILTSHSLCHIQHLQDLDHESVHRSSEIHFWSLCQCLIPQLWPHQSLGFETLCLPTTSFDLK